MRSASQTRRFRVTRVTPALLLAVFLGMTTGCAKPRFPSEIFTVHGEGADYPVMVSRPAQPMAGRAINAESGTHQAASSRSYTAGNTTVTVTTTTSAVSELPAASKLLHQVGRSDKWLQLDGAEFYGEDVSGYSWSQADRTLNIRGKVGQ